MSGALLCLDVTEAVVDEAIRKGCNLIVSHHPLIFRKLARISDENYVQCTVRKAIKNDITIVADAYQHGCSGRRSELQDCRETGPEERAVFGGEKEVDGVKGGSGVIGEISTRISLRLPRLASFRMR